MSSPFKDHSSKKSGESSPFFTPSSSDRVREERKEETISLLPAWDLLPPHQLLKRGKKK